jgi:hypothetical protein
MARIQPRTFNMSFQECKVFAPRRALFPIIKALSASASASLSELASLRNEVKGLHPSIGTKNEPYCRGESLHPLIS